MHFGLRECFVRNIEFQLWSQLVMAVPLLPHDKIVDAWTDLKVYPIAEVPAIPLQKFKNYVEKTWITQRLHVLSVFGCEIRTNNSVESYNSRWNGRVQVKNPNFWDLCVIIKLFHYI